MRKLSKKQRNLIYNLAMGELIKRNNPLTYIFRKMGIEYPSLSLKEFYMFGITSEYDVCLYTVPYSEMKETRKIILQFCIELTNTK